MVSLLSDECLQQQLRRCFAGLNALVPRVIKLGVTGTSAVSEPRTTATTATKFPRFRDDAAFGTGETNGRRDCWCVYVDIDQNTKMKTRKQSLHSVRLGLTFTGFDALKPPVISVSVAGSSTILVPSTARSTTTGAA